LELFCEYFAEAMQHLAGVSTIDAVRPAHAAPQKRLTRRGAIEPTDHASRRDRIRLTRRPVLEDQ
jgi:hypothetical protein